jgi:ubiquinone/menaquinone biosynthesis C-methylase UbiE
MAISFDRVAHLYDATRAIPAEAEASLADAIVRLSGATAETRFLEPGIGTGRIALPLVRRGHYYTGVDVSERMMDELRGKLGPGQHRLTLVRGDGTAMPFGDASFDVAITAHVLHLIEDWRAALAEIRRVLSPGGLYLFCEQVWNESSVRRAFRREWNEISSRQGMAIEPPGAWGAEVLAELREQGAELETFVAASWREPTTVREVLDLFAERVYSSQWKLSDEAFEAAMSELRARAADLYPSSMEVPFNDETTFEVTVARGWADESW